MSDIITHPITKWSSNKVEDVEDFLAVEEPLEIRLEYLEGTKLINKSISITMRTPGDDFNLALGFLYTEGILSAAQEIVNWKFCGPIHPSLGLQNIIKIKLADHLNLNLKNHERFFCTTSSCGVCGKSSIESIGLGRTLTIPENGLRIPAYLIKELPDRAKTAQQNFSQTGGIHATALFNLQGELLGLQEDVGRHNAMDKMIGEQLQLDQIPFKFIGSTCEWTCQF